MKSERNTTSATSIGIWLKSITKVTRCMSTWECGQTTRPSKIKLVNISTTLVRQRNSRPNKESGHCSFQNVGGRVISCCLRMTAKEFFSTPIDCSVESLRNRHIGQDGEMLACDVTVVYTSCLRLVPTLAGLFIGYRVRIPLESCSAGCVGACCARGRSRSLNGVVGLGPIAPT